MIVTRLLPILITGLVARGIALAVSSEASLLRVEYSAVAANLNAGRGFVFEQYGATYVAWKEPLYIALLAALTRWMGDRDPVILVFQTLFGLAAACGIALLARSVLGDPTRATLAGCIAAASPFLVYYDTRLVHSLSMDAFLFVSSTGAILLAVERTSTGVRWAILAGIVSGVALWQRATLVAAGLAAWGVAILTEGRGRRRALLAGAAVWLAVSLATIAPWLARNYLEVGRPVVTTDFAHILWLGNNAWSNGTFSDMAGRRVFSVADPAFQRRIQGAPEVVQYDTFLGEALAFVAQRPAAYAALTARRLWAFVWFSPNAGATYTGTENALYRLAYVALLTAGGVGLVLYWQRAGGEAGRRALVPFAAVAGLAVVHALTAINLKHRVPFELVLAIFAAETVGRTMLVLRPTLAAGLVLLC